MTNYSERLDGVLYRLYNNAYIESNKPVSFNENVVHITNAKQALTSLIKELVAEAKPSKKHVGDEIAENRSYTGERLFNATIDKYHTNLLKALEEV